MTRKALKPTETHIVKGCLRKDQGAMKALYERYKVSMFRLCLRYAQDQPEAEDMLQEGFIQVFKDLHQFTASGPLGGWIRRVMVNKALQIIRKRKRLFASADPADISEQVSQPADVFAQLNLQALTRLIQQLPAGYRLVFNMYVIEGYSHQEIAETLDISVSTSKTQLFKAKASLRRMLEKIMIT